MALYTSDVIIPVEIKLGESGVYSATSPLVKGLLVVSKDRDLLIKKLVPEAMADLTKATMSAE